MAADTSDEIEPIPPFVRAARAVVALVAAIGLFYLFGGHQAFLLRRTPPQAPQPTLQSELDVPYLSVPLTIFVVRGEDEFASERNGMDVQRLVDKTDRIWRQANVGVYVRQVHELPITAQEYAAFVRDPDEFIAGVPDYDATAANVFLVRAYRGVNGIAFGDVRSIAVADFTSVPDFRVLAHEVGHILSLDHVPGEPDRLMFQGAAGTALSTNEVLQAREAATKF